MSRPELALIDLGDRDEKRRSRTTVAGDEALEVIEQFLFGESCNAFEGCRHDDAYNTGFSDVVRRKDATGQRHAPLAIRREV